MQPELMQLILSIVLVAATIAYTGINWKMLKENRIARQQKIAPLIIPYLKSTATHEMVCLYIKNMGEGCARDVRVQIIKDYHVFYKDDYLLSNHPIFTEGVNVFPSGYELHYNLNWWDLVRKQGMDDCIELEITCTDINGCIHGPHHYKLKLSQIMSNYTTPPDTYQGQTAYYLKEIHKELKNLQK